MADVSPASIRSQLLHDDNENESATGFVSQLPLATQLPFGSTPYTSEQKTLNSELPNPRYVLDNLRNPPSTLVEAVNQPEEHVVAPEVFSEPKGVAQEPVEAQDLEVNHTSTRDAECENRTPSGIEPVPSSNESLDCQPLHLPMESTVPDEHQRTASDARYTAHVLQSNQPFPLVDWIRTIRAETTKKRSTLPLRWVRSVPKAQKAILDADDAWMPPLAGKDQRPGTIPIDILNILTIRADHVVNADKEQDCPRQEQQSRRKSPNHTEKKAMPPPLLLSPPSVVGKNEEVESDSETMETIEWSSSPPEAPRPRLPPDTSPVPQPDPQMSCQSPHLQTHMLDVTEEHSLPTPGQSDQILQHPPRTIHEPRVAQQQVEDASPGPDDDTRPSSPLLDSAGIIESRGESDDADDEQIHTTTTIPHLTTKVQVKETPYPLKDESSLRKQQMMSNDNPVSSFVLATFPEGNRPQTQSKRFELPKVDLPTAPKVYSLLSSPRMTRARQPSQQQPRPSQSLTKDVSPQIGVHSRSQPVPIMQPPPSLVPFQDQKSPEHVSRSKDATSRKRVRTEDAVLRDHSDRQTDSDYRELDDRRKMARREFYRSRSKPQAEKSPDPASKSVNEVVRKDAKTSSISSSPPLNTRRSLHYDSDDHMISETNVSIHDSVMSRTLGDKPSRRSSLRIEPGGSYLASIYTSFRSLYPSYCGNEKSFLSALQLLSRLRSQGKEPHSFLWDDFVYRLAHDYKAFLQECIEQDESAVPYEVYYHQQVSKPEYLQGCINGNVLDNLESRRNGFERSLSGNLTNISARLEPSNGAKDTKGYATSPPVPYTTSVQSHDVPTATVQETPALQRHPRPQLMQPPATAPRRERSVVEQDITSFKPADPKRKRRSLPWSNIVNTTTQIGQPTNQATITPKSAPAIKPTPESSAKVEKWLTRAPGAESPELLPQQPTSIPQSETLTPLPAAEPPVLPPPPSTAQQATPNTKAKSTTLTPSHSINTSNLRLPKYLAAPETGIIKSIESLLPLPFPPKSQQAPPSNSARQAPSELEKSVRKRIRRSELPVTLFTMFARNYADLPEEKRCVAMTKGNGSDGGREGGGINIYNW